MAGNILTESGNVSTSYMQGVTSKWSPLLEGLSDRTEQDRYVRGVTAMLMENQRNDLQGSLIAEDTKASNAGSFTKFIFPILRRVFPNLIANEIVSVQPMTGPVGVVFYMDYVYSGGKSASGATVGKGGTAVGNTFPNQFDRDYTSEFVNKEFVVDSAIDNTDNSAGVTNGARFGGAGAALVYTLKWTPTRILDTSRGFSVKVQDIKPDGSINQQAVGDVAGTGFTGDVGAGAINPTTGAITSFKFTAAVPTVDSIRISYYYDGEINTQMPTASLDIRKETVTAETRRLKSLWSSEATEDLKALHGIDAETELVGSIAQEIALEIDRDIINDLYVNSGGTTGTFDRVPPAGINELDHLRSIVTQIATVSNLIHKKTLRAPANFIVTSPEVSALLAQLTTNGDFRPLYSGDMSMGAKTDMPRPLGRPGQFGIYKAGTLMNKWIIYEDPYFTRDQMLIGLKGEGYLNAGYAWAPYVPLSVTPTFLDPSDQSYKKGLRTRYAKKLLRSDFYGKVSVTSL